MFRGMGKKLLTVKEMARMGGLARAKTYGKRQIREWGRRGGRPRKLDGNDIERLHERLRRGEAKLVVANRLGISVRTLDRYLVR